MEIAYSIIIISAVIALGKTLGRLKIFGISLGVTWVLFVGIVASHFGNVLDPKLLHFVKDFGLILFVYSIGMQVGPSLFTSYWSGGLKLNLLASVMVLCGVAVTCILIVFTDTNPTVMVGVMSGAVTNTPGLGAAQQAFSDAVGGDPSTIGQGYAVAYPLGVVGCILSLLLLKSLFKGENISPVTKQEDKTEVKLSGKLVRRKISISKHVLNGVVLSELEAEKKINVSITKILRSGVELTARPDAILQLGDVLTVVGTKEAVAEMEKVLGNSIKRLNEPNLVSIFAGIALGCALGSIPFHFPGIPQPVKLGLAGGPLIVAILISHFGPRFRIITYTTTGANLMIREMGISLFLACVGLEAGVGFVDTIVNKGGFLWIIYGAVITVVPILFCGLLGKFVFKLNYNTLIGVLSGASTNPPALAYCGEQDKNSDEAAVGYATVYPLTMFLRVLAAQILILAFV